MESSSVNPVFIKLRDIPDADNNRPSVLEMCLAAERVCGQGTIIGAQSIRGLWRIYPSSRDARNELLVKGMRLRNISVQVSNNNPFIVRNETGEEKLTTKVWIDSIPISVADSEIEHSLTKIGCELRSDIKKERARDVDNKLTRFLTGRRFVFITVPEKPLEKILKVSIFTANIFHREQKSQPQTVTCNKCLELGHYASVCEKEVVCRACRVSGHKKGDPQCQFSGDRRDLGRARHDSVTATDEGTGSDSVTETNRDEGGERGEGGERCEGRNRGRTNTRQTTIRSTLTLEHPRRHRSETPNKRRRSDDTVSPCSVISQDKQARRDDPTVDRQRVYGKKQGAGEWG